MKKPILSVGIVLLVAFIPACRSLGPRTLPKDRVDYSESIGESWMRQTLLNIVKLRYETPPVFVEVASVVGGYTVESDLAAGVGFAWPDVSRSANLNGRLHFADRPTITYTPLTGNKFLRNLLIPIGPEQLFFCVQAGWDTKIILNAGLASINGLRNRTFDPEGATAASPEFLRALELFDKIRQSGLVGVRIVVDEQRHESTLLTIHDQNITGPVLEEVRELRRLLRLNAESHEFRLVFGSLPGSDRELAVHTRSIIQIMLMIAAEMEVPPQDIERGRTIPGPRYSAPPFIHIRCSSGKPEEAAVAVRQRDHWFWVDDHDVASKRGFSFLMLLFTLADTSEPHTLPLVTIPAQ